MRQVEPGTLALLVPAARTGASLVLRAQRVSRNVGGRCTTVGMGAPGHGVAAGAGVEGGTGTWGGARGAVLKEFATSHDAAGGGCEGRDWAHELISGDQGIDPPKGQLTTRGLRDRTIQSTRWLVYAFQYVLDFFFVLFVL